MSRYQDVPQNNFESSYGQSYGNDGHGAGSSYGNGGGGNGNYGGYSDEPSYAKDSYPMSSGNPYASQSPRGFEQPQKKSRKKLWIIIGVIVALIVIIGAVLGGVLGSRASNDSSSGGSKSAADNANGGNGNAGVPSGVSNVNSEAVTATNQDRYLAIATNSQWMLPVYPTGTATAGYSAPTASGSGDSWPADNFSPSSSNVRPHPRLGAPQYKWDALNSGLIANDPYFKYWNETIVNNASATIGDDTVPYNIDGGLDGSGVLDVAREIKVRVKQWAYAYKVTNETRYADRVYRELQAAAGNDNSVNFGNDNASDRWNSKHFLDIGEFCAAFAIGYDWLHDYWNDEQKTNIRNAIVTYGLTYGLNALENNAAAQAGGYAWWTGVPTIVNGNWNCVNNAGLTMASLAILEDDTTDTASKVLALTVPNAMANCFQGAQGDGTWSETANYWYFGTTGAAEMVSALITAYGSDSGLSTANPGFKLTSDYHMSVQGMTSLFNYGDHGPNKFSSTANSLLLWSTVFSEPRYALYQRDQYDSPEPWSMFWYDPAVSGTWWDEQPLDTYFPNKTDEWAAARSSWSDLDGSYWAMKSGELTGHQTHGDLDIGDFVVDAMGERFFGELGSAQYLSPGYFSSEAQDSQRWLYYRKRTEGQNTILINYSNQNVDAQPTSQFGTTGTKQGAAPSFTVEDNDTAFFSTDMTSAYNGSISRGIRFLNGRKQILVQDDIAGVAAGTNLQWRAHTNASVTADGTTATLTLNGKTLQASILSGPSGATFSTMSAEPMSQDPPIPTGGQYAVNPSNDGVTVLVINSDAGGDFSLQVLLNPQWDGMAASDFVTPPNVAVSDWSVTSHNA